MLKELNSIARGLLGLHGYPTSLPARVAPAASEVSPAQRSHRARQPDKARVPAGTQSCGVGCVSLQA